MVEMLRSVAKVLATLIAVAFLLGLVLGLYRGFRAGAAMPSTTAVGMAWSGRSARRCAPVENDVTVINRPFRS
ncbi:hypothetical protein [Pseudonocardia sp. GCM10023141]|uniref:hypothetical protein n=1 Tax=Pseudonocardia sp. GCM10023141 TaxID=3252653 RepID=UPI00360BCE49